MEIVISGYTYRVVILENPAISIYNPMLFTTYMNNFHHGRLKQSELELMSKSIREEEPIRLQEEDIDRIREILERDLKKLRDMRIMNYSLDIYISDNLETRGLWKTYKDSEHESRNVLICFNNILEVHNQKKRSSRGSIIEHDKATIEAIIGKLRNERSL
jgi:hypothetical protein